MINQKIMFKRNNNYIDIYVPLTSQGKFRCKTRNNFQEYGVGFAPKTTPIPNNAYLEWQIGYDKIVGDVEKETSLKKMTFIGANGKEKNPYELSEILYYLYKDGLISKKEIVEIMNTINNMNCFLQDMFSIQASVEDNITINGESFFKSIITLPTFNKTNESCGIITQISIEKQQYASGVQPMLYVNIPVIEFENSEKIIGSTSSEEKYGILRINRNKVDVIKNIFICFGMCSSSHHHDILEILKLVINSI